MRCVDFNRSWSHTRVQTPALIILCGFMNLLFELLPSQPFVNMIRPPNNFRKSYYAIKCTGIKKDERRDLKKKILIVHESLNNTFHSDSYLNEIALVERSLFVLEGLLDFLLCLLDFLLCWFLDDWHKKKQPNAARKNYERCLGTEFTFWFFLHLEI